MTFKQMIQNTNYTCQILSSKAFERELETWLTKYANLPN